MHRDMIVRITKYDRNLRQLKNMGFERVFANNIGDPAGIPAAAVRKDFSLLKIIGQKRGGYDIDKLIANLDHILGKNGSQNAAVIGCGRIGGALLRYNGFESDGIRIVAGFDINTRICEEENCPVPVYSMDRLEEIAARKNIMLAIITVPEQAAPDVFHRLIDFGVRGFLNFTSSGLKAPREPNGDSEKNFDHIVVHNVNIGLEMEQIIYELNMADKKLV